MKLKSLVLASVAAGAAFIAQGAGAQTIERTTALITLDDGVGGFNSFFGDNFAASATGSAFTDIFTFNVSGMPFDAAGSLTSSYLNTPLTKDLQITGLALYRYDPVTNQVLGNAISGINNTGFGQHPIDAWSLEAFGLQSGAYAIRVDGQVLGAGGGSFGADFTISPVPEPQTWGMLLAGLGLLGASALRYRTAQPRRAAIKA
jgi:hypothetical protein